MDQGREGGRGGEDRRIFCVRHDVITADSCRRWHDIGATLVVALLPADNENLEKGDGMTRLTNPVLGMRCANQATTRVAPTKRNVEGRRLCARSARRFG